MRVCHTVDSRLVFKNLCQQAFRPISGTERFRFRSRLRIAFENFLGSRNLLFLLLDRPGGALAAGLALGLLRAARDVNRDRDGHFRMQRNAGCGNAQGLDRVLEHHLAPVDRQAGGGGGVGDVARRNRAVQAARLTRLADDHDGQPADTLGQALGFLAALDVLRLELRALLLEPGDIVLARTQA
jgi:hypothetical protein